MPKSSNPDPFLDFVLEQLEPLGGVTVRAMFGGHGLYRGGAFFGIVFRRALYFKTDDATRGRYVERGMKPFRPSSRQTIKSYYQVPGEVLENPRTLAAWAKEAAARATARRK